MPVEQIDLFKKTEFEKHELQDKIFKAITAANERIDGAISEGHFETMLKSVLSNEVNLKVDANMELEIHLSIEAADGNRNMVDYQLLAAKIADAVRPGA